MNKSERQELYRKDDQAGRDIWKDEIEGKVKAYQFTEIEDYVDCFMTGNTNITYAVEVKYRKGHYAADFENEGWLYEEKKHNEIHQRMKEENKDRGLYVTITQDRIMAWDVTDINPDWSIRNCTRTTTTNYQKGAVPKSVTYLKPEDTVWNHRRL